MPMDSDVLDTSLRWAASEGWEPGWYDAAAFACVDDGGWFCARDDAGQITTTLSAVRYDDSFGFMGLYITAPELRGRGIGRRVWSAGREHLACRSVGLDGVVHRQSTYESDGFRRSHLTSRYGGQAGRMAGALASVASSRGLVQAQQIGADALAVFETRHALFPASREHFLSAWLSLPEVVAFAGLTDSGELHGWGSVRRSVAGWRIGPLFALDHGTAINLLAALAGSLDPNSQLYIDVPEPNAKAIDLMIGAGFEKVFACVRMYAGEQPDLDLASIYGNTTFELG